LIKLNCDSFKLGVIEAVKKISCSPATFIQENFDPVGNNSLNINENHTNKKRCMTLLLYYYLSGQEIPTTITITAKISQVNKIFL